MERLKNWRAKRAGGRITIYYIDEGVEKKVVGIDEIEATDDGIIATDRLKTKFILGTPR